MGQNELLPGDAQRVEYINAWITRDIEGVAGGMTCRYRPRRAERDMHQRSGLLTEIEASTVALADAGEQTLAFLREHIPEPGTVPALVAVGLAGHIVARRWQPLATKAGAFLMVINGGVLAWFAWRLIA